MTRRVRFLAEARRDFDAAADWHGGQRASMEAAFITAVDQAVEIASQWPGTGRLVDELPAELDVRMLAVRGFRYVLVYTVTESAITVLAVAHERRQPGYWRDRL